MSNATDSVLVAAVRASLPPTRRYVLAVSGGIDSMTLLDAAARVTADADSLIVATFDHGTGAVARGAVSLVQQEARSRSLAVRVGRARLSGGTEAEWRAARLSFLRSVAEDAGAVIVTGHTQDDHVETVLMRVLRGSGVRGLAGLLAAGDIVRPLLGHTRVDVQAYASARELRFVDDPTNRSRSFLRNRIRLDLLPAILGIRPSFSDELLDLARRARDVRTGLEIVVAGIVSRRRDGGVAVPAAIMKDLDEESRRLLWQTIAAGVGVRLDWRGTRRIGEFARRGRVGSRCQVSGGHEVIREHDDLVVTPNRPRSVTPSAEMRLEGEIRYDAWRFSPVDEATIRKLGSDPWVAGLPAGVELIVRGWKAGDRMSIDDQGGLRRVKRFFADAGIAGPRRAGWPVVLVGDRVVWIPGVRRSPVVERTAGSSIFYRCERYTG